ncbi:MAG TPA: signal peptidase I, partial [Pyrinomonadaceae bacterium]|nr:signal peptidase I [Pyrinomonadaceae bacterium]
VSAGARSSRRAASGDVARGGDETERERVKPARGVLREYFESLVVTAVMALFGMTFIVQAVKVPTGSMQNTILIGDHLLVNKFIFAAGPPAPFLPQREIRRGDIIVFKYPGKSRDPQFARFQIDDTKPDNLPFKTNYVKRVVGLPGDTVEVRGPQVLVNGQPLTERVVAGEQPPDEDDESTSGDERGAPVVEIPGVGPGGEGPYTVFWREDAFRTSRNVVEGEQYRIPPEHYFVMGDNRDNSQDSRYWGYVHRDLVIGRAMLVYWSYDESAERSTLAFPFGFFSDFITNTRWSRTGTLVK